MNPFKIAAIARLTLRAAVHSRLVLTLLAATAVVVVAVPLLVTGDGTAAGRVRILLHYTLGGAGVLLAIATLWAGCASIAGEIEGKSIRLLAVKPVHRAEIWLGKWLGLVALDAAMLALAGAAVYGLALRAAHRPGQDPAERGRIDAELLAARRRIAPRPDDIEGDVRRRAATLALSADAAGRREQLAELRKRVRGEALTVLPGAARTWEFALPLGRNPAPLALRFRLSTLAWYRLPVTGEWLLETPGGEALARLPVEGLHGGTHSLDIPPAAVAALRAAAPQNARAATVVARFVNRPASASNLALFDGRGPVELLAREGRFGPNLGRALLVLLGRLALVAAVGLTTGAVFSTPVAVFTAVALLVMTLLSRFFVAASAPDVPVDHHGGEAEDAPGWLATAGAATARGLYAATAPVLAFDPISRLADGILLPWGWTGRALALMAGAYPGALLLVSGWMLSRRELARTG